MVKGLEKGLEKGKVAGRIQTLQEVLGEPITSDTELDALELSGLTDLFAGLQQRLRNRDAN